jgi:hypothetical protein
MRLDAEQAQLENLEQSAGASADDYGIRLDRHSLYLGD